MSKGKAKFTQSDVARAIRAIQQTGAKMVVEITPDGTIRIVPIDETAQPKPPKKTISGRVLF